MKTIDYTKSLVQFCKHDTYHDEEFKSITPHTFTRGDNVIWEYFCPICEKLELLEHPMVEYIYIGCCPTEEDPGNYSSLKLCTVFLKQLKNTFRIPKGGELKIKRELGGGGYYDVIAEYHPINPESVAWALHLESYTPEYWTQTSKQLLKGV